VIFLSYAGRWIHRQFVLGAHVAMRVVLPYMLHEILSSDTGFGIARSFLFVFDAVRRILQHCI